MASPSPLALGAQIRGEMFAQAPLLFGRAISWALEPKEKQDASNRLHIGARVRSRGKRAKTAHRKEFQTSMLGAMRLPERACHPIRTIGRNPPIHVVVRHFVDANFFLCDPHRVG
jgi:hypothetical protein